MKQETRKKKRNQKGFTLVEMIVVIAIIGVLAAMMVPSLLGFINKANTSNNRAAATNVGRVAQAVLTELNDPTIASGGKTYTGTDTDGLLTISGPAAATSDSFTTAFNLMMSQDKFKGSVEIIVNAGKLTRVLYSEGTSVTVLPTSDSISNQNTGVYPED